MAISLDRYAVLNGYSRVLSRALNEKDEATRRHCERVIDLAAAFGFCCRLSSGEIRHLRLAAGLHDIGKIGIRDVVLLKPGKFDEHEWREMKSHSERGQRIVRAIDVDGAEEVALAVRSHHEDFDGGGYPDGLRGEDIPVIARMVAIVDAYDAMAQPRPYQTGRDHEQIMEVMEDERGVRFDPWLLDRFRDTIEHSRLRTL